MEEWQIKDTHGGVPLERYLDANQFHDVALVSAGKLISRERDNYLDLELLRVVPLLKNVIDQLAQHDSIINALFLIGIALTVCTVWAFEIATIVKRSLVSIIDGVVFSYIFCIFNTRNRLNPGLLSFWYHISNVFVSNLSKESEKTKCIDFIKLIQPLHPRIPGSLLCSVI